MSRRTRQPAQVNLPELRRAKYLDVRAIGGTQYVVTPGIYRAPFPQNSTDLRAAAEKALLAELETSLAETKKP